VPAKYRVEITSAAEADIAEIWEYIAHDNPDAATKFVNRMEEQIGTLESVPTRCPLIPENELLGTAYRHFLYGNYRTIFKVAESRAIIMRVLHEARLLDWTMLERPEK
jgi:plasmid stabilization system protein ParE